MSWRRLVVQPCQKYLPVDEVTNIKIAPSTLLELSLSVHVCVSFAFSNASSFSLRQKPRTSGTRALVTVADVSMAQACSYRSFSSYPQRSSTGLDGHLAWAVIAVGSSSLSHSPLRHTIQVGSHWHHELWRAWGWPCMQCDPLYLARCENSI